MAGRRPKAPEERRTKVCYIRLTEAEWRKIQSDAIDAGLPFATYVRSRALGIKPRVKPQRDKVMDALLYELTSMATNLGQLVEATGDETYGPWANYVGGELVNRVTDRFDLAPLIEREIEAINGIGHAINAMARRANMGKEIDPADRDETLTIMRRVLDPLHKAVAKKPVQIDEDPDTDASPDEGAGMRFKVPRRQPESFRASALYLAGEIKGLSPDRVEFVEVRNLFTDNARAASSVMEATAAKSVRCKQPAYHFMITFDPKDAAAGKVTPELKRKVAQQVIERMGLTEHQLMVYSHQDTEHPHMHFLVNRIHPQKHVAYDRHQDGKRLTGIVHELAREHGLNILRNREYERQLGRDVDDLAPALSDGEYWKARREEREALIPLGKDATADLRRRLKDDFYQSQTWAELNHRLTQKGITMERKGQGLILSDGERFAKLSDMGKGVRFNTLEERFGERFDDFMASRAAEIARDDREGQQVLDTSDLEPEERRTVEGMLAGDIDTSPEGDAVRRADQADMDYRYWIQIEAAYRSRKGRVRYAEQQEVWHAKQAEREAGWITKREASFLEGLAKVYKDANKARARWDDLEKKLGVKEAEDAIRKDPFLLGAVKGVRIGDYRSRDRAEAKKSFRYIMQRRQKLRDARLKHGQAHHEIEQARRRTKAAVRDLEIIQNIAGSPAQLRKRLAAKIAARARALERLNEKALKRANLADDRKEQLERTWRMHKKRQLERERTKERGRPFGLDLDLFDD